MKKILVIFSIFLVVLSVNYSNINAKTYDKISLANSYDYDKNNANKTNEDDFSGTCKEFAPVIRIGGTLIFLLKIVAPLIIIVKASINMVNVVKSGKPDDLKKDVGKLTTSLIAAILIFFVPTIVNTIFSFVSGYNNQENADFNICRACLFYPLDETCSNYGKINN